jgi:hypothetical protein
MGAGLLSPEDLQLLSGLPGLDAQAENLQRQLAAAAALRGRPAEKHSTPWGTVLGGIGDIIGNVGAGMQQSDLQGQLNDVTRRQGAAGGVGARLKALMEQQRLQAGQQDMDLGAQRLASGKADAEDAALQRKFKNDPTSAMGTALRSLMTKYGQKVAPTASAAELLPAAGLAEKGYQVDENSRNRALARQALQQRTSGAADALQGESLDMLARRFLADGSLPAMGQGAAGAALKVAVVKRAAELGGPGVDLASAAQGYKANTASLSALQRQADAINAFERTALANGEMFLQKARGLGIDTGSPLFNASFREFSQKVAGNPKMTEFTASRQAFVQEVSKILSGAMGNAPVSDSARSEAQHLLSPDASLAQIEAAYVVLKKDMENRKQGLAAQLAEIRGRSGGGNAPADAPIPSASGDVGGLSPEKARRLAELRAKAAAGTLQ